MEPLPQFEMLDRDGRDLVSTDLSLEGPWILIYVQPGCRPCDMLLNGFKREDFIDPGRVVIVVGGASLGKARAYAEPLPELAGVQWTVDHHREGFSKLKLEGVPVVLGLKGGDIHWRISGLAGDVRSIALSWLGE